MKIRIISGVVAIMIVAAAIVLNLYFSITVVILLAVLAAIASYEMLYNTGVVKNKAAVLAAAVYSALMQFAHSGRFFDGVVLTAVYILAVVCVALRCHGSFSERQITMALSMPILLSYAFASFGWLLNAGDRNGLFYFILLLNFSSVADCFAYFTGRAFGRHKLAPVISPKKTVEGSVGGVIGSLIGTLAICLIFGAVSSIQPNLLLLLAVTPVFCVLGMLGDLFASAIKRTCGIKDYGWLMPGHGGVLDRVDSLLLISPMLAIFLSYVGVVQ